MTREFLKRKLVIHVSLWEMVSWLELATDYGIATAIGVVMNQIAKRIFPSDTIKGDPRWVYYLSIFTQTFIFPPLCLLSWRENNFEFSSWYNQPWATLPSIAFNRAYMAALWGYWVCHVSNSIFASHSFFQSFTIQLTFL